MTNPKLVDYLGWWSMCDGPCICERAIFWYEQRGGKALEMKADVLELIHIW